MRKLITWLSKRFPEQLTVSKAEYLELREELGAYNQAVQAIGQLHKQVAQLEADIKEVRLANGFTGPSRGFKLER